MNFYNIQAINVLRPGSQYDITLKCWNRLDFYSSNATSEQLTRAAMLLCATKKYISPIEVNLLLCQKICSYYHH